MKVTGATCVKPFRSPWMSIKQRAALGGLVERHVSLQANGVVAPRSCKDIRHNTCLGGCDALSHKTVRSLSSIVAVSLLTLLAIPSSLAEVPEQSRVIDRIMGGTGTYVADEGVYKVVLPQEKVTIVQDYQKLSPNTGLNSWVAFPPAVHHEALLTGQFLLLEDEVDHVLTAEPGEHQQLLFVRFWEQGRAADLATKLRYALNVQVGVTPPPSTLRNTEAKK